ncbi:heterokaryon incompatibility protein-domain-containing protein [Lasiosphaeria hispida]|uniref:Heterokaryon incompatibility protein-domain-containing protein n=1 Tax=Lasiosphaeria hispida TaxID=260671 RepID=A0AAJ0H784_9PEZI|nr:heterokaryon incompatibility protein-domain-containing protein [Lasiosphaeria hispida]
MVQKKVGKTKTTIEPINKNKLAKLWDSFVAAQPWHDPDVFKVRFEYINSGPSAHQVHISTNSAWAKAWFSLFAEHESVAAQFVPRRPSLWKTTSNETASFIQRWIDECDTSHDCFVPPSPLAGPKRLIRIGKPAAAPEIHIVDTMAVKGSVLRYVALSYCWGDPAIHHQLLTVRANIDDHKKHIDFSSLPRTIQDAITTCGQLNVSYIWVDALCIIQDDDQEKMIEIANMGQIYTNAYLTIAASRAEGANDGFLQPRPSPYFSAPLILPDGTVSEAKWCPFDRGMLGSTKQVVITDGDLRPRPIKQYEPLHQRGWTFQEAMLSKRILLFSTFQPYWVCRKASRSGGDPSPAEFLTALDLDNVIAPPGDTPPDPTQLGRGDPTLQSASDFGYPWPWVAENYSLRVLSVLTDKLFAIHAVKDRYREAGATYLLGIWLENLTIDLLWSTVRQHERSGADLLRFGAGWVRNRITHLPSWSWLAFDGSIRNEIVWHAFYIGKARHRGEVAGHVRLVGRPRADGFGRLVGAPMRLRGRVKRILVVPVAGRGWGGRYQQRECFDVTVWDPAKKAYRVDMMQRASLESRIGVAVFDDFVPPFKKGEGHRSFAVGEEFDVESDFGVEPMFLDCLLVATVGNRQGDRVLGTRPLGYVQTGSGDETAYGLVLGDVDGFDAGRRCRVGLFRGDEGFARYFDGAEEAEFDFV